MEQGFIKNHPRGKRLSETVFPSLAPASKTSATIRGQIKKMKRKWLINPKEKMSEREREEYWTREHGNDEFNDNVWGINDDKRFLSKITAELNGFPRRKSILIPGCGSRNELQNHLAENASGVERIVCCDFEKIVEIPRAKNRSEKISYEAKNSTRLGYEGEFDIVLVVNSLISESDEENRDIVRSCSAALAADGVFVAIVPTINAAVEIATLDKSKKQWLEFIDAEKFSIYEPNQKLWQTFYPPIMLRRILRETGLKTAKMEVMFFDSPEMLEKSKRHYGIEEEDVVIYELFVVAQKA